LKKSLASHSDYVFLNLPFEKIFEPVFVAYVVGLVTLGLVPRSVIELDEDGEGRMGRLFQLLKGCSASVHDLSYRGSERRYNMPFELGVAYALARYGGGRKIFVFEAARRDLLRSLTDLRHFDPKCHGMKGEQALEAVYECFFSPKRHHAEETGREVYRFIIKEMLPKLRGTKPTLFNKRSFLLLIRFVSLQVKGA
jgi:hypothetical protein